MAGMTNGHGFTREVVQEVWVEVACDRNVYAVLAGLIGCEVGVVVAEFPDPQKAYEFALDFKMGRARAVKYGSKWEAYVREVDRVRKFEPLMLQSLLARK
jgi:hypothetical protein